MTSSLRRHVPMFCCLALLSLCIPACSAGANALPMSDGGLCTPDPLAASCEYRGYGTTCSVPCDFPPTCTFTLRATWVGGGYCCPTESGFYVDCVCEAGTAICRPPYTPSERALPRTYCDFCGGNDGGPRDAAADAGLPDADIDASTDDADSDATVAISDLAVCSNCMPIVAPDPIRASWTATVGGATGATATLTSATLTITGASTVAQELTVDVPVITLTDGAGSAEQRKVAAATNPSMACGALCGASTARLDLTFLIDGASVSATADGAYGCAF